MKLSLLSLPACASAEKLFRSGPQASWPWFTAIADFTLAPGDTVQVAALQDGGDLVAALPLVHMPNGGFRALTAPYSTNFSPAAKTARDAYRLGAGLKTVIPRRLELDALDADDPASAAFLQGLRASGLVSARYRHFINWHEDVSSFADYWQARPARLRQTVRRKSRKLRDIATFRLLQEPGEIRDGIAIYEQVYADSGKVPEPHPAFMGAMMEALAHLGDARLGVLSIKGQAAAVQLWLVRGGQATIFKLAHRQEFSASSPGTLLTHWMFSQLLAQGQIRRVDFGRGDDSYKRDWLGRRAIRWGVIACNPRNPAGLCDIAAEIVPTWAGRGMDRMRHALQKIHQGFQKPVDAPGYFTSIGASGRTSRETGSITTS